MKERPVRDAAALADPRDGGELVARLDEAGESGVEDACPRVDRYRVALRSVTLLVWRPPFSPGRRSRSRFPDTTRVFGRRLRSWRHASPTATGKCACTRWSPASC